MEMNQKVFIACAIGGGLGALLAHQFWYPSFGSILLGLIIGAIISFIAFEFKSVLLVIPVAWRKTISWRPNKEWWRLYFTSLPASINVAVNMCIFFAILFFLLFFLGENKTQGNLSTMVTVTSVIILVFWFIMNSALAEIKNTRPDEIKSDLAPFFKLNPVYFYLWFLPKYTLIGMRWIIKLISTTAKFAARFCITLTKLIYSEERLLCLVYGGMGAVVGTLVVNTLAGTLIGAVSGGVLGVANYEILSKRILHLVPLR